MAETEIVSNIPTPNTEQPLNVADIENAVKAIDYACDQGAYKGWNTIEEVRAIRNRLVLFLRQLPVPVEKQVAEAEGGAE